MAGVGSTNAMKKGSGNNPFLAYSEVDMQGYLNSAYTGCIVKYTGDPISRYLTEQNKTVAEYAQNLVFDTSITNYPFASGYMRIKIQKVTASETKTLYITAGVYNRGTWYFEKNATGYGTTLPVLTDDLTSSATNVEYLKDIINDQGNITKWLYDEDVTFTIELADYGQTEGYIDYSKTHAITIVPYKVNELYKVVYGDGEYYYEEYYHISDTETTANSDYIAVGKTAFDFTGNLQTGNGSKVNPYLANTIDELKTYLTSAYKGAFVKVVNNMADTDGTTYYKDSIYQVVDDGTTLTYAVLPELVNEGTSADLAKGKQLINAQGEVVEGNAARPDDFLAKYANKQLTEFVTDEEIDSIGDRYADSYSYYASFTLYGQSLLSKVVCTNVKELLTGAFSGCNNLTYLSVPKTVKLNNVGYFNGTWDALNIFPEILSIHTNYSGIYVSLAGWGRYDVLARANNNRSDYSSVTHILAGALLSKSYSKSIIYLSNVISANSRLAGRYGNNYISTIYMGKCENILNYTFGSFQRLKSVYLDNAKTLSQAFYNCPNLTYVYCPNAEYLYYTFASSPALEEPYDFPNAKYFYNVYASTLSTISSINLPEATTVACATSAITSIYMPKVEHLELYYMTFSALSIPTCKQLYLYSMPNLETLYAPNVQYVSNITYCNKISAIDLPEAVSASTNSLYSTILISACSALKTISLPKFSQQLSVTQCLNLETIYCPDMQMLTLYRCALASGFTVSTLSSIYMNDVNITSDTSIYVDTAMSQAIITLNSVYTETGKYIDVIVNSYSSMYLNIANTVTAVRELTINKVAPHGSIFANGCKVLKVYSSAYTIPTIYCSNTSRIEEIVLSNIGILTYFAYNCSNLSVVYRDVETTITNNCFVNCPKLSIFINVNSNITTLVYSTIFSGTPISQSSHLGYFGSIYVPNSLVSQYKTTSGWSVYSARITSITDLPQKLKDKYDLNNIE